MSTLKTMAWALDLKDVQPLERLSAIYFANNACGFGNGIVACQISIRALAHWCGCAEIGAEKAILSLASRQLLADLLAPDCYRCELDLSTA